MKYTDKIFCDFVMNALSSEDMIKAEELVVANGDSDASVFASMAYYDANSDLVSTTEEDDDFYSHIYSIIDRNRQDILSYSADDKNKSTMKTFKFSTSEIANIESLVAQFAESEDKNKSLKENLVDFYMSNFPGTEGEEASTEAVNALIKGVKTFNTQLNEALKQDIDSGEVNYIDTLAAVGADKSLADRYAMYASFLVLLETLEDSNLNENEMSFVESFASKKNTKFRIPDGQEVTQEMIDEIICKINECLSNSTFTLSTLEAARDLRNAIDSDERSAVVIETREEDMRAKLILATCTYIATKKGEVSTLDPETKPEFVALGVAAGVEEEKVLTDLAQGNIDESKAAKILKIIGAVALTAALVVASAYLTSLISVGIGAAVLGLLGQGFLASLVCCAVTLVTVCSLVTVFTLTSLKILEIADNIYDKVVKVVREKIVPAAKQTWRAIMVWVKSKLPKFFTDDHDNHENAGNSIPEIHDEDNIII